MAKFAFNLQKQTLVLIFPCLLAEFGFAGRVLVVPSGVWSLVVLVWEVTHAP